LRYITSQADSSPERLKLRAIKLYSGFTCLSPVSWRSARRYLSPGQSYLKSYPTRIATRACQALIGDGDRKGRLERTNRMRVELIGYHMRLLFMIPLHGLTSCFDSYTLDSSSPYLFFRFKSVCSTTSSVTKEEIAVIKPSFLRQQIPCYSAAKAQQL
jgi:hypothetical protein